MTNLELSNLEKRLMEASFYRLSQSQCKKILSKLTLQNHYNKINIKDCYGNSDGIKLPKATEKYNLKELFKNCILDEVNEFGKREMEVSFNKILCGNIFNPKITTVVERVVEYQYGEKYYNEVDYYSNIHIYLPNIENTELKEFNRNRLSLLLGNKFIDEDLKEMTIQEFINTPLSADFLVKQISKEQLEAIKEEDIDKDIYVGVGEDRVVACAKPFSFILNVYTPIEKVFKNVIYKTLYEKLNLHKYSLTNDCLDFLLDDSMFKECQEIFYDIYVNSMPVSLTENKMEIFFHSSSDELDSAIDLEKDDYNSKIKYNHKCGLSSSVSETSYDVLYDKTISDIKVIITKGKVEEYTANIEEDDEGECVFTPDWELNDYKSCISVNVHIYNPETKLDS